MHAASEEETVQFLSLQQVLTAIPPWEWTAPDVACIQGHLERAVELSGLTGAARVAAGRIIAALKQSPFPDQNLKRVDLFHKRRRSNARNDLSLTVERPSVSSWSMWRVHSAACCLLLGATQSIDKPKVRDHSTRFVESTSDIWCILVLSSSENGRVLYQSFHFLRIFSSDCCGEGSFTEHFLPE